MSQTASQPKSRTEKLRDFIRAKVPEQHLDQFLALMEGRATGMEGWEDKYCRFPVSIQHFIDSPYYLDKAGTVYPVVMDELVKMNSGSYVEVVLTGGIGAAKTTAAIYTQAYQLYLLSCLKNPHELFGLDPSSEILLIFQNINAKLAKGVDYQRFRHMIETSKYFKERFPFNRDLESKMVFPNRIEVVPVAGTETAAIGQNVIGGIIDELNYMAVIEHSKMNVDQGTYDQAVQLYNSIARRRKSRFMTNGQMPGILCLVSSKRYPGEFTDRKIEEAKSDPTIYVYDKRVWEVKPEGTYSGERFSVFIGDEHRKPRMLKPEEMVDPKDRAMVDSIPVEFKSEFETDIINALREIAGHSTLAKHPFFTNLESVSGSMGKVQSIFSREDVDFVETQLQVFKKRFFKPEIPRFAHVDLALTSDSVGLVIGCCTGFTSIKRGSATGESPVIETLPKIRIDGVLEIKPPKGGEILFYKMRNVFYVLRELGLNLKWVTFDSFQSTDSMQMMRQKGFLTGYCSMDTSALPYDVLKTAIYDGRVEMPLHHRLLREIGSLEKDPKKGKIDHPPRGSKDCADALAGVVYGLTMRREIWAAHSVPIMQIPASIKAQAVQEDKSKNSVANSEQHGK